MGILEDAPRVHVVEAHLDRDVSRLSGSGNAFFGPNLLMRVNE